MIYGVLIGAASVATASVPADNGSEIYAGPFHYCGMAFSVDLVAGEKVEMREGPDFLVGALVSDKGGYGIYEGNFPQGGTDGELVDAGLGKPVKRMPKDEYGWSYLVATGERFPAYVHVFGQAFAGSPKDFALLRRMSFEPAAARQCAKPTYRWKD